MLDAGWSNFPACCLVPVQYIIACGASEGFFETMKNERFYWRDWSSWSAKDFIAQVDRRMVEYNESRRKLSLGWRTPMEYQRAALKGAV